MGGDLSVRVKLLGSCWARDEFFLINEDLDGSFLIGFMVDLLSIN